MENKVKIYVVLDNSDEIVGTGTTALRAWRDATDDRTLIDDAISLEEGEGWTCRCLVGEWKDAE